MTKSEEYFQNMMRLNKEAFVEFGEVHANFVKNPEKHKQEFNELGRDIQDIIRDWEDKLCSHSENSKYAKFSTGLSEKFWELIRARFPKIDYIGVKSF